MGIAVPGAGALHFLARSHSDGGGVRVGSRSLGQQFGVEPVLVDVVQVRVEICQLQRAATGARWRQRSAGRAVGMWVRRVRDDACGRRGRLCGLARGRAQTCWCTLLLM